MSMATPELKIGDHVVRIRPAVGSEFDSCAERMSATDPWQTYQCSIPWCANLPKWRGSSLFLAEAEKPIGFMLLQAKGFLGSPYIAAVAVAPEFRTRGIGSEMLHFAETVLAEERHIYLCLSSFNSRAFALYQRHGFAKIGELQDFIADGTPGFECPSAYIEGEPRSPGIKVM